MTITNQGDLVNTVVSDDWNSSSRLNSLPGFLDGTYSKKDAALALAISDASVSTGSTLTVAGITQAIEDATITLGIDNLELSNSEIVVNTQDIENLLSTTNSLLDSIDIAQQQFSVGDGSTDISTLRTTLANDDLSALTTPLGNIANNTDTLENTLLLVNGNVSNIFTEVDTIEAAIGTGADIANDDTVLGQLKQIVAVGQGLDASGLLQLSRTVNTTSSQLISENLARLELVIQNKGSVNLYVRVGTAAATVPLSYTLPPFSSMTFTGFKAQRAFQGITASGSTTCYLEATA